MAVGQTRSHSQNRGHKRLEDATLQLGRGVPALFGATGRRILTAWVAGARDPQVVASSALGTLQGQRPQVERALAGQCTTHHGKRLALVLELIEVLDRQLAALDQQIGALVAPLQSQSAPLASNPGGDIPAARDMLAALGPDLCRFGDAARFASWAGVGPGHNERGGKRPRGTTRQGH